MLLSNLLLLITAVVFYDIGRRSVLSNSTPIRDIAKTISGIKAGVTRLKTNKEIKLKGTNEEAVDKEMNKLFHDIIKE